MQQSANQEELDRLRVRIEALERTVKLGTVEFVLEDSLLKQKPTRLVKRTTAVRKK